MNRLLITMLVVLSACVASAGGNPGVRIYIDFDQPHYTHTVEPPPYTTLLAYVCLDNIGEGVTSVSFMMERPDEAFPGVIAAPFWDWYFPTGVIPMDPWPPYGVTVPSNYCLTSDPLVVGCITMFYIQGSCCLEILDHPDYPRWVGDCSSPAEFDQYCVLAHGSIGGTECPQGDCGQVPVEPGTWGSVKALYR